MAHLNEDLATRLADVDAKIADAARAAGRDPAELTRIVVTKFHPASMVRELYELGVRDVGENRHQEAAAKAAEVTDLDIAWHFVGQLQSNKARAVRRYASAVHSVDRGSLVDALAARDPGDGLLDCFVELNLTDDASRGGVQPAEADRLAEHIAATPGLRLRGVMAVAPLHTEPRGAFALVRRVSDRIRAIVPEATAISAGMSDDFTEAINEGATHLRIGTAITGKRSTTG
ncbi:YggS family pyridoxal phosphate-dependent enzyme [Pseudolysinimonas sp.]|uniref:YggS family pyridoxal phosphate-dependent enzyme n=1 Tax=Pseudolysinimonas sp. TaxID=2680009 RepID=UPI00286B1C06|nr:YggS family pyridoxal phosphate-dependent enzyme [Pseudolysinimonas sp.]